MRPATRRSRSGGVVWCGAAAVVALQIPYPLVHGRTRDALTIASVVVFAATTVATAARRSRVDGLLLLVVAGGLGFAAEVIGVHTGFPFGRYHYTGGLGPTVLDVPVVVPLAWVMMALPAAAVAARVVRRPAARVVVAAVALAGWDVFLDPQMVDAHHWRWRNPDPHLPGIGAVPLSNFAGWLGVALVLMAALQLALRPRRTPTDAPAVVLWVWTWLSSALANVAFFGRPAVAAWGMLAMGVVGVPLLLRLRAS